MDHDVELTIQHDSEIEAEGDCDSKKNEASSYIKENGVTEVKNFKALQRSSVVPKRNSFWIRVRRITPHSSSTFFRQAAVRSETVPLKVYHWGIKDVLFTLLWMSCCWMFCGLYWIIIVIWDYFIRRSTNKSISSIAPTTFPTFIYSTWRSANQSETSAAPTKLPTVIFIECDLVHGCARELMFLWTQKVFISFLMRPACWTITVSICTNLNVITGKKFWTSIFALYLSSAVFSTGLVIVNSYGAEEQWIEPAIGVFSPILWTLMWWLLVRILQLEWRVNSRWLPGIVTCICGVFIVATLPMLISSTKFLKDITMYVPLYMTLIEYFSSKVIGFLFDDWRNNNIGITLLITHILAPLEVVRFASFVLLFLEWEDGGPLIDIFWNVIFSILGEIYTHTQIWQLCKNEMDIRFYGRRFDDFSELYHYFSSVRSHLEYVAPVVFFANVLLTNAYRDYIPIATVEKDINIEGIDRLMKYKSPILAAYYILEFSAELICWRIRKLSSYERISAIGDFKWPALILMIVMQAAVVDLPGFALGFLRILF